MLYIVGKGHVPAYGCRQLTALVSIRHGNDIRCNSQLRFDMLDYTPVLVNTTNHDLPLLFTAIIKTTP
jgi:hypothetical protein